jgi:hypothetical protein
VYVKVITDYRQCHPCQKPCPKSKPYPMFKFHFLHGTPAIGLMIELAMWKFSFSISTLNVSLNYSLLFFIVTFSFDRQLFFIKFEVTGLWCAHIIKITSIKVKRPEIYCNDSRWTDPKHIFTFIETSVFFLKTRRFKHWMRHLLILFQF